LAQRGHTVHVLAASREGWGGVAPFVRPVSSMLDGFHLHHQDVPRALGIAGAWPVVRLARALRPDVVMERYYNFSGAGIWAAHQLHIPSLLEVNALIVDPPAVFKRRLDDWLGNPMRRWAVMQCQWAHRIVTPLHTTVPPEISRDKIVELPWGADVERFARCVGAESRQQQRTALFLGSFRAWHGVTDFVRAAMLLLAQGYDYAFVLVGDGPQRAAAEQLAQAWPGRFHFTGTIPYEQVPDELCRASVGVAPFSTRPHPALRAAGFFWSPLKVYEYMAAGLPVVTTNLEPLNRVIRDGHEGVLFEEEDIEGLANAIARVLENPQAAQQMGARARVRVVEHFSWQHHCCELERVMGEAVGKNSARYL
jgi:glycosyltransferase involved in cell wall biosynthesis